MDTNGIVVGSSILDAVDGVIWLTSFMTSQIILNM
jgi:hypothetical protein